jgi:DNA-binding transcriptional regulator YiaG
MSWHSPGWKESAREYHRKRQARDEKKAKANGKAKPEAPPPPPPPSIEELATAAGDLITCQDILGRFGAEVENAGLVGETGNAKILFLALTSRLFERPVSIAIKGVSSVGKSFTVEQVLKFFPPASYFVRTGMSERAIIYSIEDYRHRFLVIFEAAGMTSEMQSYLIRTLLSEGRVVYEVVEKTKEGLRPRRIEKKGPTGLITTTTAPKLHPENETRLLSLGVIDTADQTKAVMQALADEAAEGAVDYARWRALQAWVATGERGVPYKIGQPVEVARALKRHGMSLRRAHDTLNRLARGDTVAVELGDGSSQKIISELFALGVNARVIEAPKADVKKIRERFGFSQTEFALRFGLELDTVQNWEQHRYELDAAAQVLLKLIENYPQLVEAVLTRHEQDSLPLSARFPAPFRSVQPWIVQAQQIKKSAE